jgi:hypothetical protein
VGRGTPSDWSGVVENLQRDGFAEKYGVHPIRILGDAVSLEMRKNGGRPVSGRTFGGIGQPLECIFLGAERAVICEVLKVIGQVAVYCGDL